MTYEDRAQSVLKTLSLREKVELCSCKTMTLQNKEIPSLGIPPLMVLDGPYGLRKPAEADTGDNLGISKSKPSTCYPTTASLACSFDKDLLRRVGEHLGDEALSEKVSVVLGPGMNIKRSPLCGRNFEYFSEDPCLSGQLAASYIQGVQSRGVGACVKHFALNNQEYYRLMNESVVDERALREIYLRGFEYAIKTAQPYEVMNSYNWYRGEAVSENRFLLSTILRDEWNFEGVVVSDFGSCNDRVAGLIAGQDVECPSSGDDLIYKAVKNGKLDEAYVDRAATRQLAMLIKCQENIKDTTYDIEEHHRFAASVAAQCMVLLKNEDGVLPVAEKKTIAVIGTYAKEPRYQGCGSALVNPNRLTSLLDALEEDDIPYSYAPGYTAKELPDLTLIGQAVSQASNAELAVLVAGLPDSAESEAMDRKHLRLPESQYALIDAVAAAQPNTVVVLCAGAPVEMPFLDKVKGILLASLGGEGVGYAMRDILFGRISPSGKLAETFPKRLEDNPSYFNFANGTRSTQYRESLFVGYRYYDAAEVAPMFAFGYGLSYTKFSYQNACLREQTSEGYTVSITLENIGTMAGAEIVQLYVKNAPAARFRPVKELRAFEKVFLHQGESREVVFHLRKNDFEYWCAEEKRWVLQSGAYELQFAASSDDVRAVLPLEIDGEPGTRRMTDSIYYDHLTGNDFPLEDFERILGRNVPPLDRADDHPYDMNSSMKEIRHTWLGAKLYGFVESVVCGRADTVEDNSHLIHLETMINETPFRNLVQLSDGIISYRMAHGILSLLNKRRFSGICTVLYCLPSAIMHYCKSLT